jgi:RNA polymerase sigma-70 factor (ECF subfamily)
MATGEPVPERRAKDVDERTLIDAAQRNPARFGELYELHFERVYAFIARRVSDRSEAQDLTADVFHQALASIGRFEWRGIPFGAWLFRIAANAVASHAQRLARARGAPEAADPPADPQGPALEEAERRARLFRLVDQLPADQRQVVLLRFAGDKSIREIALALERSEGAVKQLQFRALQNLRVRVGEVDG